VGDVSRETPPGGAVEARPAGAAALFPPERVELAERYVDLLAGAGVERGLIGPRERPRLWTRHLLGCAALSDLIPVDAVVCDVGSGAGLPGIVLALARPDLSVTLVEPLLRRSLFLEEVAATLELDRVEVVRARAEEVHGQRTFDVVTSRAVAPLPRLLNWSMPLVAPRGVMVAMKGRSAGAEVADAGDTLKRLRCAPAEVLTVGDAVPGASATVVRVVWAQSTRGRLAAGPSPGPTARRRPARRSSNRRRQAP
jgi:16S rRNA (guanine527-N7)-methyltransferase